MSESVTTPSPTPSSAEIRIERRFEGFAGVANGGYLAGLLYRELGGAVEVTLRRPTPVGEPLDLRRVRPHAAELWHDGALLASATRAGTLAEAMPPVGFDRAVGARETYRGRAEMPVTTCFVCGIERSPADALRLFSGEIEPGLVAAAWVPGPAFGDAHGEVSIEYTVAALDCPGGWAIVSAARFREPMVLGRVSVHCLEPVRVGLPYVVTGLATGEAGPKRFATTAIHDAHGRLHAVARSVWFPQPRKWS
jgi:hypothetical protein